MVTEESDSKELSNNSLPNEEQHDAIGNTVFSKSFVLRTLLKLDKLNWDNDIESDLCYLWDMTVEKDVCIYLTEFNFPSIACTIITHHYDNSRLVEILIGILANIFCVYTDSYPTEDQIETVINLIDSDDPLILIQILRFLLTITHNSLDIKFIDNNTMTAVNFILKNSTNDELLSKVIEFVSKVLEDFKLSEQFVTGELVENCISAFQTFMDIENVEFEIDTQDKLNFTKFLIESIKNICAYMDQIDKDNRLEQEIKPITNKYAHIVEKVFKYYSIDGNIYPINEEFEFFISANTYIFPILDVGYSKSLLKSFIRIMYNIKAENEDELFENLLELNSYIISKGDWSTIKDDLKNESKRKLKYAFQLVMENEKAPDYNCKLTVKKILDATIN